VAHEVKRDDKRNLIIVKHSDRVDRDDLWNARLAALKMLKDGETPRILVDMREGSIRVTTTDRFEFAQSHNKYFASRTRVAKLIKPDDLHRESHRFAETVSLNRGFMLRVFEDEQEAERWLRE
jgi:hypothetical protein